MKKRILTLGISATHDQITVLPNINDPACVSDFDALAFDPIAIAQNGLPPDNFGRRQNEIRDLVNRKGGVAICFLRQINNLNYFYQPTNRHADTYGILDTAALNVLIRIRETLRVGTATQIREVPNSKGSIAGYLRVLQGALRFAAYLDVEPDNLASLGGAVLSVDSVGHPIAVEFAIGPGLMCFVPFPEAATGDRVGAAIYRIIKGHFGGPGEIEAPPWLVEVGVPGATSYDSPIAALERSKKETETEIEQLKQKRDELLNYRVLLYGYGKSVLEPAVRTAFRLLDFEVPEPEQYKGEWDVELHEHGSSLAAIGEVEGSEGPIDVDKFRQLSNYVQEEALEGRDYKGVLIGNGFRLTSLDAAERHAQFSDHALRGAKKNGFCLLPTTELFKAVCAVLESPGDERLKIEIRRSILATQDVWTFASGIGQAQTAATASAASGSSSASAGAVAKVQTTEAAGPSAP